VNDESEGRGRKWLWPILRMCFQSRGEAVVEGRQVLQKTLETHSLLAVMLTWQRRRNLTGDSVKSVAP
jgi:hypothetical protein